MTSEIRRSLCSVFVVFLQIQARRKIDCWIRLFKPKLSMSHKSCGNSYYIVVLFNMNAGEEEMGVENGAFSNL